MNATTETIHSEIYPELFKVLPEALPEFAFVRFDKGYRSTNTRKLSGEDGESAGKVYVYAHSPGYIKDYRSRSISLWDYIQQREGLTQARDVVRKLAELAGMVLPEQELSPEALARAQRAQRIGDAWEVVNEFCMACLSAKENKFANTPRAESVRKYLTQPLEAGGRGYTPDLIKLATQTLDRDAPKMELGYLPLVAEVKYQLQDAQFTPDEISAVITSITELGPRVGRENSLTYPYRDHTGRIKGMVFRTIEKTNESKYLNSSFDKGSILFNLRALSRDRDLVIVEAPLDAMHAMALGINNITALGGAALTKKHVDLAIRYGATQLTLMLDNDSRDGVDGPGAKGTARALDLLQQDYPTVRVYVGRYPAGIKDLDELLVKQGVAGFMQLKATALPAWAYRLDRIVARFLAAPTDAPEPTFKQTDAILAEIVTTAADLSPIDRDLFINNFQVIAAEQRFPVTTQSITQTVTAIRQAALKRQQQTRLQALLTEARGANEAGDTNRALALLHTRSRDIQRHDKADTFAQLSAIRTEQQLKDTLRNRPEPLHTGYVLADDPLLIPAAAISIVAGATSHGKSILLANLVLNLAGRYPDKTFHLFSYEVDEERYLINLLNPYIGDDNLAYNNRESIEHYYRGQTKVHRKSGTYDIFSTQKAILFDQKRAQFFAELIDTGRIKVHYVTYDSDALIEAIRYLHQTEPLGAILIDYIQLIYAPPTKGRTPSRQEEIKQMCIDFKDLAIETGLPLVFGAQFNREVNNLAQMHASKLGEAGDLERIADLILGIWNNDRKSNGTPSKAEQSIIDERAGQPNTWYVEILKRRGGRVEVWDSWDYAKNAAKVSS
ncbi:DnaB-like helicase C-terminal domain-containing protein [Spirosoma pomorum]